LAFVGYWHGGTVKCNKQRKYVLSNQNTTYGRTIKAAVLTAALTGVLATGVEITPSLARPHHPAAHLQHNGPHRFAAHLQHKGAHRFAAHLQRRSRRFTSIEEKVRAFTRAARAHPESGMSGIASVYHDPITANGEHMNPNAMTAAHKTLPFGSRVTVFNRRNGRSATVRINDRGPYVSGRVIDLSPGAARVLGVDGLAPVSLRVGRQA
jgi:rare lipoprotein A